MDMTAWGFFIMGALTFIAYVGVYFVLCYPPGKGTFWSRWTVLIVVLAVFACIVVQQCFFNTFHAWISSDKPPVAFNLSIYDGQWCEYGAEDGGSMVRLNVSDGQFDAAQGDMSDNSFEHGGILVTFHTWGFGIYNQTLAVKHVNYDEYGCMDRFGWAHNY